MALMAHLQVAATRNKYHHVIIPILLLSNMMNVATKVMYYEQRQRTTV
jgi:hypothetical protein